MARDTGVAGNWPELTGNTGEVRQNMQSERKPASPSSDFALRCPIMRGKYREFGRMRLQTFIGCAAIALLCPLPSHADKIKNQIAVFAALDKVAARIQPLKVKIDQTVIFGGLKITPRVCNTRPPTEAPVTAAFVEVDEIQLDKSEKRIFTGWMFAQNPGLHAVEHPVFDVWLTNCKTPLEGKSRGSSWKPAENP